MTSLTVILDVLGHDADEIPTSKHLKPLELLLVRLNYTSASRREILEHAARFNTIHGCECVEGDEEASKDLDVLESYLTGNAANWPAWTDEVYVSLTA